MLSLTTLTSSRTCELMLALSSCHSAKSEMIRILMRVVPTSISTLTSTAAVVVVVVDVAPQNEIVLLRNKADKLTNFC